MAVKGAAIAVILAEFDIGGESGHCRKFAWHPEDDEIGACPHRHLPANLVCIGVAPFAIAGLGDNDGASVTQLSEEAQRPGPPAWRDGIAWRWPREKQRG